MCFRFQKAEKASPKIPEKGKAKFCRNSERYMTLVFVFLHIFCPNYFLCSSVSSLVVNLSIMIGTVFRTFLYEMGM